MKLETLEMTLNTERSGSPCGVRVQGGTCGIEGFKPSGRCWLHGAALRSRRGTKLTKKERNAQRKRITARMQELGILPSDAEMKRIEAESKKFAAIADAMKDELAAYDFGGFVEDLLESIEKSTALPDYDGFH